MKKALIIAAAVFLAVFGFWHIAIPESLIVNTIEKAIPREDIYLKTEGLKKGLFYSCSIEKAVLNKKTTASEKTALSKTDTLLAFENADVSLNLLSLLRLRPGLDFNIAISGGNISGQASMTGNEIKIDASNIKISGIPLFEQAGLHGEANLSGSLLLQDNKGNIIFSSDNMGLKNASFGGVPLPLELFYSLKGAMTISGDTVEVQSFALEGKGIYARIKGLLKQKRLNMIMELMTDSSFKSEAFPLWMLEAFKVSPGNYAIPINTTLTL